MLVSSFFSFVDKHENILYIILLVFRSTSRSVQLPHSYHRLILRVFLLFYSYRNNFVYESCNDPATKTPSLPPHLPPPSYLQYTAVQYFFSQSVFLRRMVMLGRGQGKCVFYISVIRPQPCGCREALLTRANICYAHTRISSCVCLGA